MAVDPNQESNKVYPGGLARYAQLREIRETILPSEEPGARWSEYAAACIAEELAGLAYILDGIRYSVRNSR